MDYDEMMRHLQGAIRALDSARYADPEEAPVGHHFAAEARHLKALTRLANKRRKVAEKAAKHYGDRA